MTATTVLGIIAVIIVADVLAWYFLRQRRCLPVFLCSWSDRSPTHTLCPTRSGTSHYALLPRKFL